MSPLTDETSSGKPSLLGSHHSTNGAPENHRVLAHLEGRKQLSPAPKHILEKGLLIALLIAGSGLYVWNSRRPSVEAPPQNVMAQAPVSEPMAQTQAPIETAPQPARILQESAPQTTDTMQARRLAEPEASTTQQTLATATTKSAPPPASRHPTPTKTKQAKATASQGNTHKPPAKRAIASTRAPSRQAEKLDSDAELLATLLQRRDPQASEQHK